MKFIKWIIILLVSILVFGMPFTASAIGTGLVTQSLSDEEVSNVKKQREFEKITSYTPLTAKCFDVRDDHMIVIGADVGDTAVIVVYDIQGKFQYGFKTKESGSFRVMWSGNDIAYYSIRSALLFNINKDGEIMEVCCVADTIENNIYDRDVLQSVTRKVGTSTYCMTNDSAFVDVLSGSYEKITKTDTEGIAVIYDARSNRRARMIGRLAVFVLLSLLIISGSIFGIKRHRTKIKTSKTGDGSVCPRG